MAFFLLPSFSLVTSRHVFSFFSIWLRLTFFLTARRCPTYFCLCVFFRPCLMFSVSCRGLLRICFSYFFAHEGFTYYSVYFKPYVLYQKSSIFNYAGVICCAIFGVLGKGPFLYAFFQNFVIVFRKISVFEIICRVYGFFFSYFFGGKIMSHTS